MTVLEKYIYIVYELRMTYTTPHTISFWLPVPALTQLGALAALNVVQVVTVLRQEFIVAGIKGQTISARL